eukprot:PLAT11344.2.p1 GENE.PLAT11344.2~~PLAT11344.2.p1  ORF type:complete len:693 (-),score=269.38 PLAT11344.2:491-2569(-)
MRRRESHADLDRALVTAIFQQRLETGRPDCSLRSPALRAVVHPGWVKEKHNLASWKHLLHHPDVKASLIRWWQAAVGSSSVASISKTRYIQLNSAIIRVLAPALSEEDVLATAQADWAADAASLHEDSLMLERFYVGMFELAALWAGGGANHIVELLERLLQRTIVRHDVMGLLRLEMARMRLEGDEDADTLDLGELEEIAEELSDPARVEEWKAARKSEGRPASRDVTALAKSDSLLQLTEEGTIQCLLTGTELPPEYDAVSDYLRFRTVLQLRAEGMSADGKATAPPSSKSSSARRLAMGARPRPPVLGSKPLMSGGSARFHRSLRFRRAHTPVRTSEMVFALDGDDSVGAAFDSAVHDSSGEGSGSGSKSVRLPKSIAPKQADLRLAAPRAAAAASSDPRYAMRAPRRPPPRVSLGAARLDRMRRLQMAKDAMHQTVLDRRMAAEQRDKRAMRGKKPHVQRVKAEELVATLASTAAGTAGAVPPRRRTVVDIAAAAKLKPDPQLMRKLKRREAAAATAAGDSDEGYTVLRPRLPSVSKSGMTGRVTKRTLLSSPRFAPMYSLETVVDQRAALLDELDDTRGATAAAGQRQQQAPLVKWLTSTLYADRQPLRRSGPSEEERAAARALQKKEPPPCPRLRKSVVLHAAAAAALPVEVPPVVLLTPPDKEDEVVEAEEVEAREHGKQPLLFS